MYTSKNSRMYLTAHVFGQNCVHESKALLLEEIAWSCIYVWCLFELPLCRYEINKNPVQSILTDYKVLVFDWFCIDLCRVMAAKIKDIISNIHSALSLFLRKIWVILCVFERGRERDIERRERDRNKKRQRHKERQIRERERERERERKTKRERDDSRYTRKRNRC